jgi:hypothetical protein
LKISSYSIQRDHLTLQREISATSDPFFINIDKNGTRESEQRDIAWERPNHFTSSFKLFMNPIHEIGNSDLSPELWRKFSIVQETVSEPVNRISSLGESAFIELGSIVE